MKQFNVLTWSFNHDRIEYYDVLPYFRKILVELKKNEIPKDREELKRLIKKESLYKFWGRCEYEMICCGWPVKKKEHKLDVHEQIMMNIDIVVDILFNELLQKD